MFHFTLSYLLVTTSKQKLFVYLLKEIVLVSQTTIWGNVQEWNCEVVLWGVAERGPRCCCLLWGHFLDLINFLLKSVFQLRISIVQIIIDDYNIKRTRFFAKLHLYFGCL